MCCMSSCRPHSPGGGGAPSYTIINVQQAMSDKIKTDLIISANKKLLTALYL